MAVAWHRTVDAPMILFPEPSVTHLGGKEHVLALIHHMVDLPVEPAFDR